MVEYYHACKIIREQKPGTLEDFLAAYGVQPAYPISVVTGWLG